MVVRHIDPSAGYEALFAQLKDRLPGAPGERAERFARFSEAGFPNQRVEAWKYTGLKSVAELEPRAPEPAPVAIDAIQPYFAGGEAACRLVFVNGHAAPALSTTPELPAGVRIRALADLVEERPDLLADEDAERSLTDLNAALTHGGAVIEVDDGVEVERPVQLLFISSGEAGVMANPRNRIQVGAGAKLRLIESHVVLGDAGLTNLVNHVSVGARGELIQDRVYLGGSQSVIIGKSYVDVAEGARAKQTVASFGGPLARHEVRGRLDGPQAELLLNGLSAPAKKEHVDHQIRIEHRAPDCHSDQYYKGILMEQGHGVFAGKIMVEKPAQRTNAYQKSANLMLSRDAEIDTKPELEIYADDVKCSHGATVGELDTTGLFYLRSRGLDEATARSLLTFAFAGEVIERFEDEDVQRQVRRRFLERLPNGEKLMELV